MSGRVGLTAEQLEELVNIHARPADQIPKGTFPDDPVIRDGEIERNTRRPEYHVVASLPEEVS